MALSLHSRKPFVLILVVILVMMAAAVSPPGPALAAPPPPDPIVPTNGAATDPSSFPPYGIPTFQWTAVSGAKRYQIQVSTTIGFTPGTIRVDVTTPNTIYTPTSNQYLVNGTLYWRVRSWDGTNWGTYNTVPWSFTKTWGIAPMLEQPAAGATFQRFSYPTFTWSEVDGAARYKVEVSGDPSFGTYAKDYPVYAYVPTFTPPAKLGNGAYYWKVTPLDRYGNSGAASETRSFGLSWLDAPTLLSPPSNPTGDPTQALPITPRLAWSAVEGADHYDVQMSTDAEFGTLVAPYNGSALKPYLETDNTSHTATDALANDRDYFWRVKAVDRQGNEGPWSTVSRFYLRWSYGPTGSRPDMRPQPLTPTNGALDVGLPLLSWSPVQGASVYHLWVSEEPDSNAVDPQDRHLEIDTPNTSYLFKLDVPNGGWTQGGLNPNRWYYWYVEAKGGANNSVKGQRSDIFSFKTGKGSLSAPNLLYPTYFYTPTVLQAEPPYSPATYSTFVTQTVAVPTFYWDRLPRLITNTMQPTYKIEVATTSAFGSSVVWSTNTQSLSATPGQTNPFLAEDGRTYYWHVSGDGGLNWSQTWKTLIDTSQLPVTGDLTAPTPLRPVYAPDWTTKWVGEEVVDTFPNLQWTPALTRARVLAGDRYRVQVARDPAFSALVENATTPYNNYTATQQPPFATYYWRVRAETGAGAPLTGWSSTSRFLLENQPQFVCASLDAGCEGAYPMVVDGTNDFPGRSLMASDPAGDVGDAFDLRDLYAGVTKNYWVVGFRAAPAATPVRYALYIDTDHADGSGANVDPLGLAITTVTAHRPEYAILWDFNGGPVANTTLYSWVDPGTWGTPQTLASLGAAVSGGQFIEYAIPKTILNEPGVGPAHSLSLALASINLDTGSIVDTAPAALSSTLDNFATMSLAPSPVVPYNSPGSPLATTPRFAWATNDGEWTVRFQAARDARFSTVLKYDNVQEDGWAPNTMLYVNTNSYYAPRTAWGDNQTIYWRLSSVNPWAGGEFWGQSFQFSLAAFVPQNPRVSTDFTMPTFSWDPVEGAVGYQVQIDNDVDFSSPIYSTETELTSYTPTGSLPPGDNFYWRVRMRKGTSNYGAYTATQTFTRGWLTPGGLRMYTSNSAAEVSEVVTRTPTLGWDKVLTTTIGAAGYKVEVSSDPGFVSFYDSETTDSLFYTASSGSTKSTYKDGTYYWRVRPVDGAGNPGAPSATMVVVKQYPQPALLEPAQDTRTNRTPTFRWGLADGAAEYEIQIATDAAYTQNLIKVTTDNASYTPVKEPAWSDPTSVYFGKPVWWRVAMIDANGNYGPFSGSTLLGLYKTYLPMVSDSFAGAW